MKRLLASVMAVTLLTGCANNERDIIETPTQVPTTAESPSAKPSQAPTTSPDEEPEPTKEEPRPEPKPSETSSAASTPAVQFAKRWGEKYPSVPEYAILKAANGVCVVADEYPDWTSSPIAKLALEEIVSGFGLNDNDAVEFTQDAQQNYCATLSNPV